MSNYGVWLDLMGPGGRFVATTASNLAQTQPFMGGQAYYAYNGCPSPLTTNAQLNALPSFGGTSAAAPHVTGVAALLLSKRPELNGEDIENVMKITAFNILAPGRFDVQTGYGLVRAGPALYFVAPSKTVAHWRVGQNVPSSIGALVVADSAFVSRSFVGVPGIGAGTVTKSC